MCHCVKIYNLYTHNSNKNACNKHLVLSSFLKFNCQILDCQHTFHILMKILIKNRKDYEKNYFIRFVF